MGSQVKMTIDFLIFQTNIAFLVLSPCSWFLYLILILTIPCIFYFIFCPPDSFLTNTFISPFYVRFCPSYLSRCSFSSILPSYLHHIFPHFHTISLPFSPPQAVWDRSCVCRPAGPDPHVLQRERWKDPQLFQHSSPLPTVCQQCQTGMNLPN